MRSTLDHQDWAAKGLGVSQHITRVDPKSSLFESKFRVDGLSLGSGSKISAQIK